MQRISLIQATLAVAVLVFAISGSFARAEDGQDGGPEGDPKKEPAKEGTEDPAKAAEPTEPAAFQLGEKDLRKVAKALEKYLVPSKKSRAENGKALEKLIEKDFDGHSLLEDVPALASAANSSRVFGSKAGRRGAIVSVKVPPEVHGFPGGVGTVNYWLYLPKDYSDKKLWPVVFALPDTKDFPDTSRYLKDVWLKNSETIRDGFIVAVPTPSAKGKAWRTDSKSYARAMIALRHVLGTFEGDRKTAGPASDYTRVFVDGGDIAAILSARFAELFAGAVLRATDGTPGRINLRKHGQLNGLAAYCIVDPGKKAQGSFAALVKEGNDTSVVVESADPNAADVEAVAKWMAGLPARKQPRKITYTIHDSSFQRHHWINVLSFDSTLNPPAGFTATCDRINNVVTVESRGLREFEVSLNDALVDLNRDVTVKVIDGEQELVAYQGKAARDYSKVLTELVDSNQPWRIYPVRITIDVASLRRRAAEAAAAAKAKEAAEKEVEEKGTSAGVTGGTLDR